MVKIKGTETKDKPSAGGKHSSRLRAVLEISTVRARTSRKRNTFIPNRAQTMRGRQILPIMTGSAAKPRIEPPAGLPRRSRLRGRDSVT
jgi:hypothetical protein